MAHKAAHKRSAQDPRTGPVHKTDIVPGYGGLRRGVELLKPSKKGCFSARKSEHENTKTAEYRAPGRPRSSRSILWKDYSIFYNLDASTMAEAYQRGVFLTFEGLMTKTEKRPSSEPQGVPEALDGMVR